MLQSHNSQTNHLLGYPDNARLLIINADDFGRSQASNWAVHPALDTPEMQAIEPESWQVRQTDFDFLISSEARDIIQQEGIVLLNYKPLQKAWQER